MVECGAVRALRIQRLEGSRPFGRAAYGISMLRRAFGADAPMASENDPQPITHDLRTRHPPHFPRHPIPRTVTLKMEGDRLPRRSLFSFS
jgi:hypothetical protein